MNICPVVETIKEIRGSGLWIEDDDQENIIKLGGSESNTSIVCDNVAFYMMTKKMDFARFKLSKPNYNACKSKYHKDFKKITGTYAEVYTRLIDNVLKKNYMYTQFTDLVDLIYNMELLIVSRVESESRAGHNINISLPDIILLPHIDKLIIYRPDILTETINKLINYINKVNINSIIKDNIRADIPNVEKFDKKLDMATKIISREDEPGDAEEYITEMNILLDQEMIVADYVREIEKYHCIVINYLNKVYDVCKKLIAALI